MEAIQIGQNGANVPNHAVTELQQGVVRVTTQPRQGLMQKTVWDSVQVRKQKSVT